MSRKWEQFHSDQGSVVRYRYSREPVPLIPGPAYPKGNSLFGYRYLAYKQDQGSVKCSHH